MAIEIGLLNFVRGKVLVVSTGFYSDRLYSILKMSKRKYNFIKKIDKIEYKNIGKIKKNMIGFVLVIRKQARVLK